MLTLLDTHAWIWWVTRDARLVRSARQAIEKAASAEVLALSLISVWEVAKKVEKGQLAFDRPVSDWIDQATAHPGLQMVELTRPILVESCRLPPTLPGDRADQLIVATARDRDAVIVSKDDRIRMYAHARSLW